MSEESDERLKRLEFKVNVLLDTVLMLSAGRLIYKFREKEINEEIR